MQFIHTFTKSDLGKHYIRKDGVTIWLKNILGYIQKKHLGKQLYKNNGSYTIEDKKCLGTDLK